MLNRAANPSIPRAQALSLAPFRALRYDPTRVDVGNVLVPPYDVIDAARRAELAGSDPHSAVRLTLPEVPDGEVGSPYDAAARLLSTWRAEGVLNVDPEPGLYVYEVTLDGHSQRGLLGALALSPAEDGIVLPHENTMAGPVADRLALLEATDTDLEAIFLVYDGGGAASQAVAGVDAAEPLLDVEAGIGGRHRLWAITAADQLAAIDADLAGRRAVIADGHHRYATYLRNQANRHDAGRGPGPWDRGLTMLVDGTAFGPRVEAIHRVLTALPLATAVQRASAAARVTPLEGGIAQAREQLAHDPANGPRFAITDGTSTYLIDHLDEQRLAASMPAERSAAWQALDVAVAHHYLVADVWALPDSEESVQYAHDIEDAVARAVAAGGTALLLAPTPVAQVAAVAAAGDRMPRKSTLFLPKPATGVAMRAYADA